MSVTTWGCWTGEAAVMHMPDGLVHDLRNRSAPWIAYPPQSGETAIVGEMYVREGGESVDLKRSSGPKATVALHEGPFGEVVSVQLGLESQDSRTVRTLRVLRVLRDVLRAQLVSRGWIPLHGAAYKRRSDGSCVILLGPKGSGKTTRIVLQCLEGDQFVSNDDVLVGLRNGEWVTLGLPRSINIRGASALAIDRQYPGFVNLLSGSSHPYNEVASIGNSRRRLFATELSSLFRIELSPGGPVGEVRLMGPCARATQPGESILSEPERGRLLRENLDAIVHTNSPLQTILRSGQRHVDLSKVEDLARSHVPIVVASDWRG